MIFVEVKKDHLINPETGDMWSLHRPYFISEGVRIESEIIIDGKPQASYCIKFNGAKVITFNEEEEAERAFKKLMQVCDPLVYAPFDAAAEDSLKLALGYTNGFGGQVAAEIAQSKPSETGKLIHLVSTILSTVHRDRGHYILKNGLDKAYNDALSLVPDLFQRAEKAEAEAKECARLFGEETGKHAQTQANLSKTEAELARVKAAVQRFSDWHTSAFNPDVTFGGKISTLNVVDAFLKEVLGDE